MEDDSSEDIVDFVYVYLTGKGYPSNCTSSMKRQIRQRSSMFVVVNGELYYKKGQDQVNWAIGHTSRYDFIAHNFRLSDTSRTGKKEQKLRYPVTLMLRQDTWV